MSVLTAWILYSFRPNLTTISSDPNVGIDPPLTDLNLML